MGQRANLIIVENREYSLHYSHWCANTLTRDLFWGPEHARDFIQVQRAVDESGWLDDVWAEGAAVLDCDNHVLLLYGGEDVLYDVPLRRVYLQMLRRVWREWEVRWAHEGIAEIADYVGYPRHRVLSANDDISRSLGSLSPPAQQDWTDRQLEATAERIRFPTRPTESLKRRITEMLLRDCGRSPVDAVLEIAEEDRKEGKDVQINPWALEDHRLELDVAERQRIVTLALDADNGG